MSTMTYGFIGLGLIGGSLARSLRRLQPQCRIMAYTRTRETCLSAKAEGIIDLVCDSPQDRLFVSCDVVFLCAPVGTNIQTLKVLSEILPPDCLITDVGSVKTAIHEAAKELGLEKQFIGGHPMTGSEKTGLANSNDHLFENAYYILTPEHAVPQEKVEAFRDLILGIGALPLVLTCEEHDFITAAVSHLPHVIASSLVNTVHDLDSQEQHMKLIAAGGFKDITRIASSSPEMWEQICTDNSGNIIKVMDYFINQLIEARERMTRPDPAYLNSMFAKARDYRDSFSSSSRGVIPKNWRIYCDLLDEVGGIATIATILAVNGINIKNIGIVHNREFEEGVLSIEFYQMEAREQAVRILPHHRYQVRVAE